MNIEAIKIDLTTSTLTQKQIAEKHGISTMKVCLINTGSLHPEIEPKTRSQIAKAAHRLAREARNTSYNIPKANIEQSKVKVFPDAVELSVTDQEDFDLLMSQINSKPGWPKVISIGITDDEAREWAIKMLKERERLLEVKLAKVTLMINAVLTNNFSDLPPSCEKELKDEIQAVVQKRQEQQPQPLASDSPS